MSKEITTMENEIAPKFLEKVTVDESMLDIDQNDLQMSSLVLVQGNHPAKKLSDNIKDGDYVDMMTGDNYGKNVKVIILKHKKSWARKDEEGTITGYSTDGLFWNDGEAVTSDENFKRVEHNFFILLVDNMQPVPMRVKFKNTSSRSGKNLLNLLHREIKNGRPMHSKIYTLSSESMSFKKGEVLVMSAHPSSFCTETQFNMSNIVVETIKGVQIKASEENSEPDIQLD